MWPLVEIPPDWVLPNAAVVNWVFPNNTHIHWTLMVVIYPYITGLVAGAFVVSSLYHVFHVENFKGISNFALIATLCFGCFAATPLLFHLGQPQRAFEIYSTPHLTSAMSIFGYVYGSYMLLLMVEVWLTYRKYFIERAVRTTGIPRMFWITLTLGITEYTPESTRVDHHATIFLAAVGIPLAFLLHGYVGFVFGSVKANVWWATPLQPLIFLLSAIASGIAMLLLLYTFIRWRARKPYDFGMIRWLMVFLWLAFILDITIELLEVIYVRYEHGHHWSLIEPLLSGPLFYTYIIGQMLICAGIPLLIGGYIVMTRVSGKPLLYLANISCLLVVLQVLLMRFNIVIGGQMISGSERGLSPFHFEFFAKEGVLTAMILLSMPFILYFIISRFIPIFDDMPLARHVPGNSPGIVKPRTENGTAPSSSPWRHSS
uniref:Ni/Fe-hydrogenase 2 integral membrane subunit HybB n=1 Tax=Candidatus Kentrum sp. TC TaxID=2126339 RepID=A0A450ZS55_9GAMM|nr:MAG: Ni/Fe-hydrogenase 2 integral membrane subunit HybB [Candidatus Kentron sp. TC]VFK56611.1 MAG: Ni/Fe-hydrogenase 2 integral membrane subunit HybB [Candidatus Kentron sp. TC]